MKSTQRLERWLSGPIGWARLVLLLIAFGGAMAILIAAADARSVAHQRASFVKVPCYMAESRVSREGFVYLPYVVYRYEIDGQRYESNTVSSRYEPLANRAAAEAFLLRFGPGADAECFVDPADPAEAMLELPTNENAKHMATVGGLALMLSLFGVAVLQISIKIDTAPPRRKARAPDWGEIDSGPNDPLARTRQILKERLES